MGGGIKILLRLTNLRIKIKLRLACLAGVFLFTGLLGQDYSAGLRFYNKYDYNENGDFSSLKISTDDPIHVEDEFTLSFDFTIRNPEPFGLFFQLDADSLPQSVLSNVNFKNRDTTYLEFSVDKLDIMMSIPIPKTSLGALNWHNISITYNMLYDEIRMILNNTVVRTIKFPMLNDQDIRLRFGFSEVQSDVPSMTLKNIKIIDKLGPRHHWNLDEYSGDYAYDHIGGRRAEVINTQWEYESHTKWQNADSLIYVGDETIAFHPDNCMIPIITDQLKIYTINTHGFTQDYPYIDITHREGYNIFINPKQEMLYGFYGDGTKYYSINLKNNQETNYSIVSKPDQYYSAGYYYDVDTNDLFMIGGYGLYRTKNHIQQFDFTQSKWDTLAVWGDQFHPRDQVRVSNGPDPDCIYIFGGQGNESGMQERGWQRFYDLWKFNRQTYELNKVHTFDILKDHKSVSLGYSEKINYFIMSVKMSKVSPIEIFIIDPETFNIDFRSTIANSQLDMPDEILKPHIREKTGKLTVPVRRGFKGLTTSLSQIYTINYPPMDPPLVSFIDTWGRYGFGIAALFISLGLIWVRWKKNGVHENEYRWVAPVSIPDENLYLTNNIAIQCFGIFKLFKYGKELAPNEWVSKKIRLLFIFITVNGEDGVSPQRLTSKFWPDSLPKSAANSRYVAFSQIRRMLNPFEGILKSTSRSIHLDYGEDCFSDLNFFMSVVKGNSHSEIAQLEKALQLYGSGDFCHDINESWMDDIRVDIQAKAKEIAERLSQSYQNSGQWHPLGELGKQVLKWDNLDGEGLEWAMRGHFNRNREAKAKAIFENYSTHYNEVLNQPYEMRFSDIIDKYAKKV